MLSSQRKQQILKILAAENQVMSGELSQRFGISEDSIRRDLRELAAEGLLQRVHGGALQVSAALASFEKLKNVQMSSKQFQNMFSMYYLKILMRQYLIIH